MFCIVTYLISRYENGLKHNGNFIFVGLVQPLGQSAL